MREERLAGCRRQLILGGYRTQCMLYLVLTSVGNGSGPSLRVRVQVQTKPLPNWWSGSSTNPNCTLRYGSMVNSQPVRIARVVSGSPSRSRDGFIYGSCICSLLIVSYQNRFLSNQSCAFACRAICNID